MQRKSLIKSLCFILLLSFYACYTPPKKSYDMKVPPVKNLNEFQKIFTQNNTKISVNTVQKAKEALNKLPTSDQSLALDHLNYQIKYHSTEKAKRFYRLNPEIKLADVISVADKTNAPDWVRTLFEANPVFSLQEFKQLPLAQKTEILGLIKKAEHYYDDLAAKMRSGSNFATKSQFQLQQFLNAVELPQS